jgi:hypothetical protein
MPFCRRYGGRQRGILAHWPEQGLLITDDQRRATTARSAGQIKMTVQRVRSRA